MLGGGAYWEDVIVPGSSCSGVTRGKALKAQPVLSISGSC